eukprot:TRINITY_DN11374_c0_g1_i1.p1 TRINITY_DN11374_c0_g1~~TRINITY_DN11374_c0_g1_i1.p1  ORF type:complete len:216 (-),score=36.02 TRINITY_DN11374_c0_g1_i1:123-770(-)
MKATDTDAVKNALETFRYQPPIAQETAIVQAAVLIAFRVNAQNEFEVLLTVRSHKLRTHAGEVAFPGGKRDKQDADSCVTALREASEEVGLRADQVQILGCLGSFVSKHLTLVTPVVAMIPHDFEPKYNEEEVEDCFFVPISALTTKENHHSNEIPWLHSSMRIHFVEYQGKTIWGLTAIMLLTFFEQLGIEIEYELHIPGLPTYLELSKTYAKI